MTTKVKAKELVKTGTFVEDAIKEVAPDWSIGLTDEQVEWIEKKAKDNILTSLFEEMEQNLLDGNSVEFEHQFNVRATTSTVNKNEDGSFKKKLSLRTRQAIQTKLN